MSSPLGKIWSMARNEKTENAYERDQRILQLRKRGLTLRAIAREVGMTANGVMHTLNRLERKPDDDDEYYV